MCSTECIQLLEDPLTPVQTMWQGQRMYTLSVSFKRVLKCSSHSLEIPLHISSTASDLGWRKLLKMKASKSRNKAHIGLSSKPSRARQWVGSVRVWDHSLHEQRRPLMCLLESSLTPSPGAQREFYCKMKRVSQGFAFNRRLFGGTFLPSFSVKVLCLIEPDAKQNQIPN